MPRRSLPLILSLALVAPITAQDLPITDIEDIPSVERDGESVPREVSGATWCQGKMWVVDNEDSGNLLTMEEDGRFTAHPLPADGRISDLEGIASDGKYLYLMAGGGLSKKGKVKAERFSMARVTLKNGKPSSVTVIPFLPWLVPFAQELGMEMEDAEDEEGEDIEVPADGKYEGLAMLPGGKLVLGIRKPLLEDQAVIVELTGYAEAFDSEDASKIVPTELARLDLGGGGISSLEWDPKAKQLLVIGLHAKKLRTELWTWKSGDPEKLGAIRGHKGEGVARVGDTARTLILMDDEDPDGAKLGRYTFVED